VKRVSGWGQETSRLVAVNATKLRKIRGWSCRRTELEARARGVESLTENLIYRLEKPYSDKPFVSVDTLVALAKLFEVDVTVLLGDQLICGACHDAPPVGFTCNACGSPGSGAV
jgi:hypothetical protein